MGMEMDVDVYVILELRGREGGEVFEEVVSLLKRR